MKIVFWIPSLILSFLTGLKNWLYDQNIFKPVQLKIPVLSVGNLSVGGTGKTPTVDFLLQHFESEGLKVAVVSRAYKARSVRPVQVDLQNPEAAAVYGDEAVLLAKRHPKSQFFVGQCKTEIAQFAEKNGNFDLILVDDGFQHRKLARKLDLVILDATQSLDSYNFFPLGRGREGLSSLKRAQIVLFSKTNWAHNLDIIEKVQQQFPSKIFLQSESKFSKLYDFHSDKPIVIDSEKVLLFSGLARPQQFKEMFIKQFPQSPIEEICFPDHHQYQAQDIQRLQELSRSKKLKLVTTEKDAVKLALLWPKDLPLVVAGLEFSLKGKNEDFFKLLHQLRF